MSELLEKRMKFTRLLPRLIDKMLADGFHPCHGKDGGKHMVASLHFEGLAVDIDLFDKDDNYLSTSEAHKPFGLFWESLDPDCRWGGNFHIPDGDHYSVNFGGRS